MKTTTPNWEIMIVMFAILVTATTGLAYRYMLLYNLTIPWFVWVLLVVLSAVLAFAPVLRRLISRR